VGGESIRPGHERLVGTIVHRLFQTQLDARQAAAIAADLVRAEERVDVADLAEVVRAAVVLYGRLRDREDVAAALASGQVWFEVPFSLASAGDPGGIVRGFIDCLVVPAAGPPVVLEFKTGDPRPEHATQVARYAAAIRSILAVDRVETKILYAGG
jgi:CRISPR/Cas system-associated exonuclease Cas4 (RecB family)